MIFLFQLQGEFELILGKGICQTFKNNWNKYVPRLMRFAKKSQASKIKSVLQYYDNEDLQKSFGMKFLTNSNIH